MSNNLGYLSSCCYWKVFSLWFYVQRWADQESESLEKLSHLFFIITQGGRFLSLVLCVVLQMVMQRWDEEQVIEKVRSCFCGGCVGLCSFQIAHDRRGVLCTVIWRHLCFLVWIFINQIQIADSYCSTPRAERIPRLCLRFPAGGLEGRSLLPRNCLALVIRKSWNMTSSAYIDWVIFLSGNTKEKNPEGT